MTPRTPPRGLREWLRQLVDSTDAGGIRELQEKAAAKLAMTGERRERFIHTDPGEMGMAQAAYMKITFDEMARRHR